MTTQNMNAQTKHKKTANPSITLRLSRGRTLKITFRPRIRVSPLLIKLLAVASGIFAFGAGLAHAAPPVVNALPTGGQVVSGVSTIQQVGSALNINQATQKTIINWQSFDIGSQAAVNFYQPNASSIALNRIVGNNASQIYGKLNANGQVFLLNPHGTLFAPGAQVNVKALLSSTMHMNDADFLAGNYNLSNPGLGIIDNQSIIYANSIAFAGNDINNSGSLIATNVSLVAGDTVAVDISGDGLIRARVENPSLQAHITNSGLIDAVHQVTMSAGQAKDTLNNVVNNSGIIKATGLSNEGGVITLQGGTTLNSGSLNASSSTGKGGTVAMLGEHVGVTGFGSINASGETGGGTILVGGDYQGKNANVQNAGRTYFGADANLKADAITSGDGGKVIVWADDVTRGYGNISARGGEVSGNGGFVEVSGKHNLDFKALVDAGATNGNSGTLLLDPNTINVITGGTASLVIVDQFADLPAIGNIDPSLISNATANVILQANNDINFQNNISMVNAGRSLSAQTLTGNINVNANIVSLGSITLNAGGTITSSPSAIIQATTGSGIFLNGGNGIGTNLQSVNVSPVTGNVSLTANGNIFVNQSGLLDTANYTVSATGANRTVKLSSTTGINVTNLSPTNFITTDDNLFFSSNGGDINIADGLSVDANSFDFVTSGVGNDVFVGGSAGTVSLNATSPFGANFTGHTVVFNNNLTDGTPGSPINNDTVQVTAGAGGISGAGGITTVNLRLQSEGAVNLTGSNVVNKIAADVINSGAAFNFNNAGALEVSSLFGITGITTNNGNVNLTGQDIAINNVIDTTGGNLTIHSSYNPLNINADLAANNVTLSTFDGEINLNAADITASGNVAINSGLAFGNSTGLNAGLITIDGNITQTGASLATLDINADTNIIVAAGSKIISNNPSNITLKSDASSNGLPGRIELNGLSGGGNEVRIDSKGGNITLTGGSGFSSTTFGDGILLNYAQLDARGSSSIGGNITLKGKTSYTDVSANGVTMLNNTIRTKGTGVIDIQGVATATAGGGTRGTVITATNMDSENGDINISGDASAATFSVANSDGVLINGGSIIVAGADNGSGFGSGNIFVTGKSALGGTDQAGIAIADSPTELDTHGTGNITLDGVSNGIGANSAGVLIFNSALIESEGSGEIAITGKANNIDAPGVAIASGATVKGAIGDYITIRAGNNSSTGGDFISFVGGSIQGTSGTIMVLTPLLTDPSASIAVGGNGSTVGNFNVSDADLAAISNIQSFQIGDTFHTGTYNVASLNSFNSTNGQINLVSNTANIDFIAPTTALNTGILVNANNGNVNFSSGLTTNAGNVFVIAKNDLTLSSTAAIANNAGNITLIADTGDFINNNSSPSALSVSAGSRWLVYSADLAGDTRGTLVYDFKQYNASYGSTVLGTGNGFLYGDVPGTLTASITGPITKDYDGSTIASVPLANLSLSGTLLDNDTVTFTGGAANYTDPNAGTGKTVNMTSITATASDGLATVYGYTLPTVASSSTAVITPKSITNVTGITAADKVYDGNTSATLSTTSAVFNGIVSGETLSVTGASGLFNSKDVATANTVNISGISLADSGTFLASNYSLALNTASDAAVITPKSITSVTGITAADKPYDGNTNATLTTTSAVFNGIVAGETLSVTGATGTFNSKDVGTATNVSISGISLANNSTFLASNYSLASNIATDAAVITPIALTITANDLTNKTYGDTAALSGTAFTNTLLANSETVGSVNLASAGSVNTASVGSYGIIASGATGGTFTASNYTITYVNGTLSVIPKALSITASDRSKVYGDTLAASGTEFISSALANGETIGSVGFISSGGVSTAGAGSYSLSANNATGGTFNPANYTITYNDGNLTVSPKSLTITAANQAKTYGDAFSFAGTEFINTALANGETIGNVSLASVATPTTANAGSYAVAASGATGGTFNAANYNIAYVNGAFTVSPKSLTLSAVNDSRIYDGTKISSGAVSTSGLVNGNTVTALQEFDSKNAGSRTLSVKPGYIVNDGNGGNNYLVTTSVASGNITPKDLTVIATGSNKLFNGDNDAMSNVALSASPSTPIFASDVPNLTITKSGATFDTADVGINKQIDVVGIAISGTEAGNYSLLNTTATAFADIFDDNGVASTNIVENNVIDNTTDLALVLVPVKLKVLNDDGSETLVNVDVAKGKVLTCQ